MMQEMRDWEKKKGLFLFASVHPSFCTGHNISLSPIKTSVNDHQMLHCWGWVCLYMCVYVSVFVYNIVYIFAQGLMGCCMKQSHFTKNKSKSWYWYIALRLLQQLKTWISHKNAVWALKLSYLNAISYKIMDFSNFIKLPQALASCFSLSVAARGHWMLSICEINAGLLQKL